MLDEKSRIIGKKEFMALRQNVWKARKSIRFDLTKMENFLLDDIAEKTINEWDSTNEVDIHELAKGLGIRMNKLYVMLKDLHEKSLIIREKTAKPRIEILGLNPAYFGQILINSQHALEKSRYLKCVVDNSKLLVPNKDRLSPFFGPIKSQIKTDLVPFLDQISSEDIEIIDEKTPLEVFKRDKKSLRGEMGEFHSCKKEEKNWIKEPDQNDYAQEAAKQLQALKMFESKTG